MSEELAELPEGWVKTTLGDSVVIEMGQSPDGSATNTVGNGLPLIGGASDLGENLPRTSRHTSTPTKVSEIGDLILCVRATIGKLNYADNCYCLGRGVAGLRPISFERDWLKYYLTYSAKNLDRAGTGTTFRQIDKATLQNWPIALPPLNEQHRIVAKIEALRARSQWAKEALEAIRPLLDQFRQSVLAAAFRGDLTADWREQNPDIEPAKELLTKNNDSPRKLLPTWCSATVEDVIEGLKYGTSQKCSPDVKGIPVLRIPNIGNKTIQHSDLKYADLPKKEFEELRLIPGDILLIRSNGSASLVGKSAVVSNAEKDFAYAGYLIRLRLDSSLINSDYLNFCLSSQDLRLQIEIPARSTSGVHNINSREVKQLKIQLPPIEEQKEIVRCIQQLLKAADSIQQQHQEARAYLDQLDQSILAKAFRGELAPQDTNDEPASVLLERIRAERAKKEAEAKAAKTTGKTRGRRKIDEVDLSEQISLPGLE